MPARVESLASRALPQAASGREPDVLAAADDRLRPRTAAASSARGRNARSMAAASRRARATLAAASRRSSAGAGVEPPAAASPAICPSAMRHVDPGHAARLARREDARRRSSPADGPTTTRAATDLAAEQARELSVRHEAVADGGQVAAHLETVAPVGENDGSRRARARAPRRPRFRCGTARGRSRPDTARPRASLSGERARRGAEPRERAEARLLGHEGHLRSGLRERGRDRKQQRPRARHDRRPAGEATRPIFQSAWAPPAPITPGSVQPGKREEELARAGREDDRARRDREDRSSGVSATAANACRPSRSASKTDAPRRHDRARSARAARARPRAPAGAAAPGQMPMDLAARRRPLVEHDGPRARSRPPGRRPRFPRARRRRRRRRSRGFRSRRETRRPETVAAFGPSSPRAPSPCTPGDGRRRRS